MENERAAGIVICSWKRNKNFSYGHDTILNYNVRIGFRDMDSYSYSLTVGTYRARDLGGLLLEGSEDNYYINFEGEIVAKDQPRFSPIGVFSKLEDAERRLYREAKNRADQIQRLTGLGINDLVKKD